MIKVKAEYKHESINVINTKQYYLHYGLCCEADKAENGQKNAHSSTASG